MPNAESLNRIQDLYFSILMAKLASKDGSKKT